MTYEDIQRDAVLRAKARMACNAKSWFGREKSGEQVDNCCIDTTVFTWSLIQMIECYEVGGDHNCWTVDEFLSAIQLLNGLMT